MQERMGGEVKRIKCKISDQESVRLAEEVEKDVNSKRH